MSLHPSHCLSGGRGFTGLGLMCFSVEEGYGENLVLVAPAALGSLSKIRQDHFRPRGFLVGHLLWPIPLAVIPTCCNVSGKVRGI